MSAGAHASFPAIGTSAEVHVTDAAALAEATEILRAELGAIDTACSRFRDDSEIAAINRAAGEPVRCSKLCAEAVAAALDVAAATGGTVVPTVGGTLRALGYDRDFAAIGESASAVTFRARRVPGWQAVRVDAGRLTVSVPKGVELDLGATAKALCADRAATAIAERTGSGVLVNLGGDLAIAGGVPQGGWRVRVTHDHAAGADAPGQTVSVCDGGLATSSTTVRRWKTASGEVHHIVDPRTGAPAHEVWRTVSVAARTCVDANAASTAAIVMGAEAPEWLAGLGVPARLVALEGQTVAVGGWPGEAA